VQYPWHVRLLHESVHARLHRYLWLHKRPTGYSSCLLEQDAPEVDEADALFMTGACSAFVSHLTNKARLVGLLT
jgi:hypothetical protein